MTLCIYFIYVNRIVWKLKQFYDFVLYSNSFGNSFVFFVGCINIELHWMTMWFLILPTRALTAAKFIHGWLIDKFMVNLASKQFQSSCVQIEKKSRRCETKTCWLMFLFETYQIFMLKHNSKSIWFRFICPSLHPSHVLSSS